MKKKIMVGIDDSKINQAIYKETAKILNIDCIIGENGQDGYDKIIKSIDLGQSPDIIVTDIQMPVLTGLELIEKLKENQKSKYIPILVVTTETDVNKKIKGKNLGIAGWIIKPLTPLEISSILNKFLNIK